MDFKPGGTYQKVFFCNILIYNSFKLLLSNASQHQILVLLRCGHD